MFDYRSMFDLTHKKALVVGAGRGIGEAGAHALAAFGAIVFCADADADAAESTAEEARSQGWKAEAVELDMLDPGSVNAAAERVGTPDVLVSTPSITSGSRCWSTPTRSSTGSLT
jgi:NAD(P)-dependent dehydrogenase (short-subunit alcohol dehydrogenase family)